MELNDIKENGQLRILMLKESLQASIAEYSDLQKNFANLDTKAQNTTAVAGVFLAAALAFFNTSVLKDLTETAGMIVLILLGGTVLLLMASTYYCIAAMRIRNIPFANSILLNEEIDAILKTDFSEWSERYVSYLNGQIISWRKIVENLFATNENKAKAVSKAQLLLSITILLVAVLLLFILAATWRSH